MPRPYPSEFRDEVVRVARGREPGVTRNEVVELREPRRRIRLLMYPAMALVTLRVL